MSINMYITILIQKKKKKDSLDIVMLSQSIKTKYVFRICAVFWFCHDNQNTIEINEFTSWFNQQKCTKYKTRTW